MQNHPKEKGEPNGIATGENDCVWMRAKVVNFKLCDREYDCAECPFDRAMKKAWKQEEDGTSG